MLDQLLFAVPELRAFANLKLEIPFNLDSSRVGPAEWVKLARLIHDNRDMYDAFLVVHGTDTMAYTAAALSFMLAGLKKPIVLTGKLERSTSKSPSWAAVAQFSAAVGTHPINLTCASSDRQQCCTTELPTASMFMCHP